MRVGGVVVFEPAGRAQPGAYDTTASTFRPRAFAAATIASAGAQLYWPLPCISSVDQLNGTRTHVPPIALTRSKSALRCVAGTPRRSPSNEKPTSRPSTTTAPAAADVLTRVGPHASPGTRPKAATKSEMNQRRRVALRTSRIPFGSAPRAPQHEEEEVKYA